MLEMAQLNTFILSYRCTFFRKTGEKKHAFSFKNGLTTWYLWRNINHTPTNRFSPHFAKMCLMWYACTATSAVQLLKMAGALKKSSWKNWRKIRGVGWRAVTTHFTLVRPRVKIILFSLITSSQVLRDVEGFKPKWISRYRIFNLAFDAIFIFVSFFWQSPPW